MADNKQYITRLLENGRIMISEDVIAAIALHTMSEVDGFAGVCTKPGADIADFIGKTWGRGIRVAVSANNNLTVDCDIYIRYGSSIVDVAQQIQTNLTADLESAAGVKVMGINVNVCGIVRK